MFLRQADAVDENEQIVATAIPEPPTAQIAVVLTPVYASPSDITNDCRVNVNDLLLVINEWGKRESVADINRDKIVDVDDLFLVVQEWAPF